MARSDVGVLSCRHKRLGWNSLRFADFCFRVENSGVALGVEGAGFSELGVARVSVEGSGVTFRKPVHPNVGASSKGCN